MAVTFRPLPWLTLSCLLALALLLWLGAWQWGRFLGKQNAPPLHAVEIAGQVDPERLVFVHAVLNGVSGWRVFAPIRGEEIALADVAFLPGLEPPRREAAAAVARQPAGAGLRGIWVLPRKPGPFAPPADPTRGLFYTVDLRAMAQALGLERVAARYVASDYHGALNPFLQVGTPPERHLGYALTWWGLAVGLVGVYAMVHWNRGRLRLGGKA